MGRDERVKSHVGGEGRRGRGAAKGIQTYIVNQIQIIGGVAGLCVRKKLLEDFFLLKGDQRGKKRTRKKAHGVCQCGDFLFLL